MQRSKKQFLSIVILLILMAGLGSRFRTPDAPHTALSSPNPSTVSTEKISSVGLSASGWHEVNAAFPATAGYAGVGFYFDAPVYVRPGQKIGFEMTGLVYASIDVKFDGGSWQQVSGAGADDFVVFDHPWNSSGTHSIEMTVVDEGGDPITHSYTVHVVPAADRGFYDGGNRMIAWDDGDGTLDNPFLVVEGFDPTNENNANKYYQKGSILFNEARNLGQDMIVLNFADGGADLAANAQVLADAINYIENIKSGSNPIKLAGVSMGGVIARYTLAEAEENGSSLNVSHFASIDAPQQGAVLDKDLQDYLRDEGVGSESLESQAAKQLLQYNAFDPDRETSSSVHNQFYNELNGLDGAMMQA